MAAPQFIADDLPMRKRFPAPKGLDSPSYADRYAESRRNTTSKGPSRRESLKKFLPSKKPLDLTGTSLKSSRSGMGLLWGIFLTGAALWAIMMVVQLS